MPGGKDFDSVFSNFWNVGQSAQILGVLSQGQEKLAVLGADFTLQHESHAESILGRWGQGKVYDPVFRELERLTNSVRSNNPKAGVIWLTHFPPGFPEGDQALELIDGANLIDFALDNHILIISGHTHNPKEYASTIQSRYPDTMKIFCAGTATQLISSVGHVIHIMNVQVDNYGVPTVERQDFWWNDDFNSFM